MPLNPETLKKLRAKLIDQRPPPPLPLNFPIAPEPPIDLSTLEAEVSALPAAELQNEIRYAGGRYGRIDDFIRAMSPYGTQVIAFPNLQFATTSDLTDLTALRDERGVEVAGWLRKKHAGDPSESSDERMTLAEKQQCFYWDFRFPDDPEPNDLDGGDPPKGGRMLNVQVTKAMRIPFVYRQAGTGQLLLGHILVGYEGAGSA
jgi:hypothetical protein